MKTVKKEGRSRVRAPRRARYLFDPVGRPSGKGRQLQHSSGDPELGDHLARARARGSRVFVTGALGASLVGVAVLACACTRADQEQAWHAPARTTSTTDPLAGVDNAVVAAWRTAEDAFFQAEAQVDGYSAPGLDVSFGGPELQAIVGNLATQSLLGQVGQGSWDLGHPAVVSLGPTESDPTSATVVSCIHDTQLLVDRATDQPVPGVLGTPD